jgi:hypothetical protein
MVWSIHFFSPSKTLLFPQLPPTERPETPRFSPAKPRRGPSDSPRLYLGEWPRLPFTARIERPSYIYQIDLSKLACFSSFGRAPMLVYVRPSNEALLRARVPGAQDQCGCPSHPSYRARSASRRTARLPSPSFGGRALREHRRSSGSIPALLAPSGKNILLMERGGYLRRAGNRV